jgi:DNA-binding beta-propeller fold protein YncE
MSLRRVGRLAGMLLLTLLWVACGQVYRPVVLPCSVGGIPGCPVESPPTPANFHEVFAISANAPHNPGGAMQIDVAGDSVIAETPTSDITAPNLGDVPTHAGILPNNSRVFVASAGSLLPGGVDVLSSFAPAAQSSFATGFGPVNTISLPTGTQPVFVNTTQNNAVYVANFGANSVSAVNTSSNVLTTASVGVNPVALAELPNGLKLYVANQGDNTVSTVTTTPLSSSTVTGFSGKAPVWVVARGDSQKVYVLTQGDGQLVTIDTATDAVTTGSLPVGAGANYIFFDPHLNRLYVTNPLTSMVYVFSDTGGPNDTPVQLAAIPFTMGSATCSTGPSACFPTSITVLADGSRFYVASYQTASSCPDVFVGASSKCVIPSLAVFDANNFALKTTLSLLTYPFAAGHSAVPSVTSCVSPTLPALYTPGATRFRVFTAAAVDSSHVYVSMCDAGAIADINTLGNNTNDNGGSGTPADSLVTNLPTAYGVCTQPSCSSSASITAFSIKSNVVTFQAANQFAPGQSVSISGLTTGTYLDGLTLTVLATGLSGSQFECYFASADVSLKNDSGAAVPAIPLQAPFFLLPGQ